METYAWDDELEAIILPYHSDRMQRKIYVELVKDGQFRYTRLVSMLGRAGTEVSRRRVVDEDPNMAPHKFIKGAVHEFIFPRQKVKAHKAVRIPLGQRGHRITREIIESPMPLIDEALVRGRLRLSYDDSQVPPKLKLEDLLGDTETTLAPEIIAKIDEIFNPPR